jgi:hypothetical protein
VTRRLFSRLRAAAVFVVAWSIAPIAAAQSTPASPAAHSQELGSQWEPLGQIPVDQASAGLRGYSLAGEDTEVAGPGSYRLSIHTAAGNSFFREEANDFLITVRHETHTVAVGYRRGVSLRPFSRFEIGGQVQLSERDGGFMNGFIAGFENLWASLVGSESANIQMRSNVNSAPPPGVLVSRSGAPIYRAAGTSSGIGDVSLVAKALIRAGDSAPNDVRVAARIGLNVAGNAAFTEGNFAGIGLSLEKRFASWVALHGDVRITRFIDAVSQWGLPLKRASGGFSVGPEVRLARDTSVGVQFDGSSTPYRPTGTAAFDKGYGAITIGAAHRFRTSRHELVTHVYARENLNLPIRISWNTDPDLAIGVKLTIRN